MDHGRFDGMGWCGNANNFVHGSVHGCEAKSVMISVHGCERLCDEVRMKEWMMNDEGCDEEMWMKSEVWCGILGDARVVWEMWWRVVKRVWW